MDDDRRREAEAWVNGYTATAVAAVLAVALVPGAATAVLCAMEATMCYQIGKFYKHEWTMGEATATASVVGIASVVGQIAAMEAAILTGPFALPLSPPLLQGL